MRTNDQGSSNKKTNKVVTAYQANYGSPATQIKKTDKSWKDVEARTGTPLATLTQLNQAKTIPPVGSFVLTQPASNTQYQYSSPAGPPKPPVGSNNYYAASMQQYAQYGPPKPPGYGQTSNNQGRGGADIHAGVTSANSVLASVQRTGQLPKSIPVSALGYLKDQNTGEVITIQKLAEVGYVSDGHGNYVLKQYAPVGTTTPILKGVATGSPAGSGNSDFMNTKFMRDNQAKNIDFLNQLRWDPKKKKYVKIGDLIRQGRLDITKPGTQKVRDEGVKRNKKGKLVPKNKGGSSAAPTVTTGQNILEGPQTVLDIHLGSG